MTVANLNQFYTDYNFDRRSLAWFCHVQWSSIARYENDTERSKMSKEQIEKIENGVRLIVDKGIVIPAECTTKDKRIIYLRDRCADRCWHKPNGDQKTIGAIFNTLNAEQKYVVYALVGSAALGKELISTPLTEEQRTHIAELYGQFILNNNGLK